MEEGLTYEQAMERLNTLAAQMEHSEIGIDDLADRLKEAQELLKYCRERLTAAEKNCNSLPHVGGNE